jgi:metallo-beta-lactamase family protein
VRLFGEEILVRANITAMAGISGHADRDMLLDWLAALETPPQMVFVNHGDDLVCAGFADLITQKLGYTAAAPYSGDGYDLLEGNWFQKGVITPSVKAQAARAKSSALYEKLLAAGRRLMKLIEGKKGASNGELTRMIDQIHSLCDKNK